MQYLWIGCLESDEEFKIKAQKGYDLASAQVSQKNLLFGLEEVTGNVFDSINGSVLPPYPVYTDKKIEPVLWHHKDTTFDISVGYKNIKYLNRINCKNAMIDAAKSWISERYTGGQVTVFVYSMRSGPMATACYIKNKIKDASIYLIVTDLPQFMDLGQSNLKAALKKVDWISIKRMQRKFDGFILYAKRMADFLNIPDEKWLLMEGSYDAKELPVQCIEKKKALMYSGKLDYEYGIPLLLDSFMKISDHDIELWLTGGGNAEDYIKTCADKDKRIKFLGFLPTREDVLKLQLQASLLVNMRLPSELASGYCFPSKLFEYMVTGTPVLSFDIAGIPREYLKHLYIVKEETTAALAEAIKDTMNLDESILKERGESAREFIVNEKNASTQCEKIWQFVRS
jgi:glycosyltransferase involved in cell wall biosynthesis